MNPLFDDLEARRKGTSLGIPRAEGEALYAFIKGHGIKTVIETGVKWGFTSYYILAALPEDGRLVSFEPDTNALIGSVVPKEWHNRWTIIRRKSNDALPDELMKMGGCDLFFHDSDHSRSNQAWEYETAFPFAKYIGSHDITFHGPVPAWTDFKQRHHLTPLLELGELGLLATGNK